MPKFFVMIVASFALAACSSASRKPQGINEYPPDTQGFSGRAVDNNIDIYPTVTKKIGITTQVIRTGRINQVPAVPGHSLVTYDVLCPEQAPMISQGGCEYLDGSSTNPKPHPTGAFIGSYPLISADAGEGFRCLFDHPQPNDEVKAIAFCRNTLRGARRVQTSFAD